MKEKATGEKKWLWRRKSKRTRDTELPAEDYHAAGGGPAQPEVTPQATTPPVEAASQVDAAPQAEAPRAEAPQAEAPQAEVPQVEAPQAEAPQAEAPQAEAPQTEAPQVESPKPEAATTEAATQAEAHPVAPPAIIDTTQPQPAEDELKIVAPEGEKKPPLERRQSRLKTWFSRVGRQSNGPERESLREVEGEGAGAAGTVFAGGAALAETDSRGAALRSHPVTGNDLATMQQRMSVDEGSLGNEATRRGSSGIPEQNGENRKPSRLRSSFMKIVSGGSQDNRTNGVSKPSDRRTASEPTVESGVHDPEGGSNASTATKEELRESAADHGLPAPPAIGKHTTNGSRESRFSEDL